MWVTVGIMFLSFILFSSSALGQENGKIYQLAYSPAEPVALEDVKISIGVENPSNKTHDYLMEIKITKEGRIIHEQQFTFSLESTKGVQFTPMFLPQDIGEFEVIVQLYDRFKVDLFDTKIVKFNSVSHIGPFDIIIEPLTSRIRPGLTLPAKILLENMGTKGTDVTVLVDVACSDKDLTQSLTVYLPPLNRSERIVSMQTCDQDGLYEIKVSILIFNKTWVSSTSQFFVNSSFIQLQFEVPEKIVLRPGESTSFPVEVTNRGNQKISDLKFVVQRIPLAWQKSSPSSIIEVQPNEKVIFIVSITVPQDAELKSYEVRMTAVAEETLERQISTLEITSSAVSPTLLPAGAPLLRYILIFIFSLTGIGVTSGLLRKYLRIKSKTPKLSAERLEFLKKIKERIRAK